MLRTLLLIFLALPVVGYAQFPGKPIRLVVPFPAGSATDTISRILRNSVSQAIGQPKATRAVAQACANNPAALVIPCHRVVKENGDLGGYRWGVDRKRSLLEREGVS